MSSRRKILMTIALAWLVGLAIALKSPADILSQFPILKGYVTSYVSLFSYGSSLGSSSSFPEVTQLYYSLMAWTIPLFFILSYQWMRSRVGKERDGLLFKVNLPIANKFSLILLLPVWFALIWFVSMNDGGDVRLISFGTSRGALGLFGLSFPCLTGVLLSASIFSIQRVFFEKG